MSRDDIERKIKSLKELAERGVEGEKINAEKLLKKLMEKYNVKDSDFESETKYDFFHKNDGEYSFELFLQIVACHFPEVSVYDLTYRSKNTDMLKKCIRERYFLNKCPDIMISATKLDYITLMGMYDIYWRDLQKYKKSLFLAFLDRNNLLVKAKSKDRKPTKEQLEEWGRAYSMVGAIKTSIIHPQLPGVKELEEKCSSQ